MTQTILLAGATGTIGRAVARRLAQSGAHVICPVRNAKPIPHADVDLRLCDVTEPNALETTLRHDRIDAVISCLASRDGDPASVWRIEHDANVAVLNCARRAGAQQMILLSAICVQKPDLAFQTAKLAFETHLQRSGMPWTIIRPTAFFKSLSGQVARVRSGKPYLLFGDGRSTACKPISDRDLAEFIFRCIGDPESENRILPIGGPGPALTPRDMGDGLFDLLGRTPTFRSVPLGLMSGIAGTLGTLGRVIPSLRAKAEFARIGHYYARESMLVWDEATQRYDADATPSFGSDTLWDHYRALIEGTSDVDLGAHAVFQK